MYKSFLDELVHTHYVEILALLPVLLVLTGLFFTVGIDPYIRKENKRNMMILLGFVLSLVVQNVLEYQLYERFMNIVLHRVVASYGYMVRPLILLLFIHIVSPGKKHIPEWSLICVNTALYMASIFRRICFWIDDSNLFYNGIWYFRYTCMAVSTVLLLMLLWDTIRKVSPVRRKENLIPVLSVLPIPLAYLLDDNVGAIRQPVSFLTIAVVLCCAMYYNWLHLQFVQEHEDEMRRGQRMQIMISQIQPHFLYNTLSTIQAMCATEPEEAPRIVEHFSRYLRQNMDSLNISDPIPVEKEIDHARIYSEIEMAMFPNIRVEFNVQDADFCLPVLTVQPLVENAVRHGVRIREKGEVKVTAQRVHNGHEVVIRDNGKGFDPSTVKGKGEHIGIANVRERLERMCEGTLKIESSPGQGTTATIFIPDRHARG